MLQQTTKYFYLILAIINLFLLTACKPSNPTPTSPTPTRSSGSQSNSSASSNNTQIRTEPSSSSQISQSPSDTDTSETTQSRMNPINEQSPDVSSFANFSLNTANKTVPPGILEEIMLFSGGGGYTDLNCPQPQFFIVGMGLSWGNSEKLELGNSILVSVCGWAAGEQLNLVIEDPLGNRFETQTRSVDQSTVAAFAKHWLGFDDPTGIYKITVSDTKNKAVFKELEAIKPKGPRIFYSHGSKFFSDDTDIILHNFEPNEAVTLYAYEGDSLTARLFAWQKYTVNSNGQLKIDVSALNNISEHNYISIFVKGQISGWASLAKIEGSLSPEIQDIYDPTIISMMKNSTLSPATITCSGAAQTRLNVGFRARVTFTDGSPNSIRSAPASANVLGKAPEGTGMDIIDGPRCNNSRIWWKVKTDNGYTGWTAEGKPGDYWLEPDE